jgi:hypothetical protein
MFHAPASTVADKNEVPATAPRFHWWRSPDEGDGTLTLKGSLDGRVGHITIANGLPYQPKPGSIDDIPDLKMSFTEDVDFGRWNYDFGTYAAYRRPKGGNTDPFQVGVRFSPARILYGSVAPDLVLSRSTFGVGASFYVPKKFAGQWSHLGLGAWYTYPLAGTSRAGSPAWAYGLSFSDQP